MVSCDGGQGFIASCRRIRLVLQVSQMGNTATGGLGPEGQRCMPIPYSLQSLWLLRLETESGGL